MEKITRKVDELGRYVIPYTVREQLGIEEKNNLTMVIDSDRILLKKGIQVDALGRIVIPHTVRQQLGIKEKQDLSIEVVENTIILTKQEPKKS